jgi:hypothetical protein
MTPSVPIRTVATYPGYPIFHVLDGFNGMRSIFMLIISNLANRKQHYHRKHHVTFMLDLSVRNEYPLPLWEQGIVMANGLSRQVIASTIPCVYYSIRQWAMAF